MHELVKVTLENEMDLILAHRRAMKLGELAGLTLSAQTTFATAVSEVSRTAIEAGTTGCLTLCVQTDNGEKYIVASVKDQNFESKRKKEGIENARRLVDKFNITTKETETVVELFFDISIPKLDIQKIDAWRSLFRNEPPISAYDEIKRKNEEIKELAEKLQEKEESYRLLTNTLPLIIFSLDDERKITYANDWLEQFTGQSITVLNDSQWRSVVHPDEYEAFYSVLIDNQKLPLRPPKMQCRLRENRTGNFVWHLISLTPQKEAGRKAASWIGFMADIQTQKEFEQTLQDNEQLKEAKALLLKNESELQVNIKELNRSNVELQQFAYVASHDLQEPVRKMIFYSDYLLRKHGEELTPKSTAYLNNMTGAANRMRDLIRDLLTFSQVNQREGQFQPVDLNQTVQEAIQDLEMAITDKEGSIQISQLPVIEGDPLLLRQLFVNLISNSIKYAKKEVAANIEISHQVHAESVVIYVKDNGIGFDPKYVEKLFALFQRLHNREEYAGTGLGLAICRKITDVHNGLITSTAIPGEGATFIITLPLKQQH